MKSAYVSVRDADNKALISKSGNIITTGKNEWSVTTSNKQGSFYIEVCDEQRSTGTLCGSSAIFKVASNAQTNTRPNIISITPSEAKAGNTVTIKGINFSYIQIRVWYTFQG